MLKSHHTTVDGLEVCYRTAGDPLKPALVFLHAWGVRLGPTKQLLGIGFDAVLEEFAKDFYAVAPEHPGLVRSQDPPEGWKYADFARALQGLLVQLELKDFVLVGSSFGGAVALAYASLYPRQVRALVLVHSVLPADIFRDERVHFSHELRLLRSGLPLMVRRACASLVCGTPTALLMRDSLASKARFIESGSAMTLEVPYGSLPMPILVLWGKRDTSLHPVGAARQWEKRWPNARFGYVDGTHAFLYMDPALAAGLVREFVAGEWS